MGHPEVDSTQTSAIHPGYEAPFVLSKALSIQWWLQHLADAYAENPLHMVTELLLIVFIFYLTFKREKPQPLREKLSKFEEDMLIAEWQPEPLVSNNIADNNNEPILIATAVGPVVKDQNNKEYIHLSSHNYLGLANNAMIKEKCKEIIKKNAVGSCGPRGFYGTVDIHLNLEKKLKDFFGQTSIIYADWIGCAVSVITAFAKRGDILVIDDGCHYLIVQGALLSRCNVIWYQHNNIQQLEAALQTLQSEYEKNNQKLVRKFIITEGIFHNHGDICHLPDIIRLKEEYKYRLILDDSHAIGVLHEKGSIGYWGVDINKIDILIGSMDTSFGTTGGYCIGAYDITYHQTLSSGGYVFSASAPPFEVQAAIEALNLIEKNSKDYVKKIQENAKYMRSLLTNPDDLWAVHNDGKENAISPLIHLRLNTADEKMAEICLRNAAAQARSQGVLIYHSYYLPCEYEMKHKKPIPSPSIRIAVTIEHTKDHLLKAADIIKECLSNSIKQLNASTNNSKPKNENENKNETNVDEDWVQ